LTAKQSFIDNASPVAATSFSMLTQDVGGRFTLGCSGFDFLDNETDRRWLFQECPREELPDEINDRRMPLDRSVRQQAA
jgi:hypothetical protein